MSTLARLNRQFAPHDRVLWRTSLNWWYVNHFVSRLPSRRVRMRLLRWCGAKIGPRVSMFSGCEIRSPPGLEIGEESSIGPRVLLDARKGLRIGRSVTIAAEAMIWTLHHDYNDPDFQAVGASVTIGDHAWICSRAIILPGVEIGAAAVAAAGCVVTKNVPPYTVVGGIPARPIGQRTKQPYAYSAYYGLHIV